MDKQKKLVGYMLVNPATADEKVIERADHKRIIREVKRQYKEHKEIDKLSVMKKSGVTDTDITMLKIDGLRVTEPEFLKIYKEAQDQKEIRDTHKLLINTFETMYSLPLEVQKNKILTLKQKIFQLETSSQKYLVEANPKLMVDWFKEYDTVPPEALPTGIEKLDEAITGISPGNLAIIMADTGVGKTNLLLHLARQWCAQGKNVLFFSLEMTSNELVNRIIPAVGDHSATKIQQRTTNKTELVDTIEKVKDFPLTVISKGFVTTDDIISETMKHNRIKKVDAVMVDYLQLLSDPTGRNDNEVTRLATISRKLKQLALTLEVPVITPVQVDKASSKSKKYEVENVAGSKAIANDADLALYMYEKEKIIKADGLQGVETSTKETYIKVVKSRHSQKGAVVEVTLDPKNLRIVSV